MKRLLAFSTALLLAIVALPHPGRADAPAEAMGGHMDVTMTRPAKTEDRARADAIVAAAKRVMARYPAVADAERDGFKKFLPGVPLPTEHFTKDAWALEAWMGRFDPDHPTSLIYERHGEALHLVGVMYTASKNATEQQLDADVPLSVARWHRHVRICQPPAGSARDPRFGLGGTIADANGCSAAGGRWVPQVFGWMVHVWPGETDPSRVWAVHRDDHGEMHGMAGMH
ncbi:MAG TPA: hypothetical protein VGT98_07495 [Candidatus Elarobacter sp.]|nr:hypothetical protein [Candidatus Elarobacter sp.]